MILEIFFKYRENGSYKRLLVNADKHQCFMVFCMLSDINMIVLLHFT